jgi:hypothetical protein
MRVREPEVRLSELVSAPIEVNVEGASVELVFWR